MCVDALFKKLPSFTLPCALQPTLSLMWIGQNVPDLTDVRCVAIKRGLNKSEEIQPQWNCLSSMGPAQKSLKPTAQQARSNVQGSALLHVVTWSCVTLPVSETPTINDLSKRAREWFYLTSVFPFNQLLSVYTKSSVVYYHIAVNLKNPFREITICYCLLLLTHPSGYVIIPISALLTTNSLTLNIYTVN